MTDHILEKKAWQTFLQLYYLQISLPRAALCVPRHVREKSRLLEIWWWELIAWTNPPGRNTLQRGCISIEEKDFFWKADNASAQCTKRGIQKGWYFSSDFWMRSSSGIFLCVPWNTSYNQWDINPCSNLPPKCDLKNLVEVIPGISKRRCCVPNFIQVSY